MINNIALKLAQKLADDGSIQHDEIELYSYGYFVLISQLLFSVIVVINGLIFSCLLKSIIFYVAFRAIRKYAGGFHASSELKCELTSTIAIIICICSIKLCELFDIKYILIISAAISFCIIFALCPLDTPEKPLSAEEYKSFRKLSIIILTVIMAIILCFFLLDINIVYAPMCISLIFEAVLISLGKINGRSDCSNE